MCNFGLSFTGLETYVVAKGEDPRLVVRRSRRPRMTFNKLQLEVMQAVFQRTHFPGYAERQQIADDFGLDEPRIQVWFKNRRTKFRQQEKMNPTQEWKCEEAAQAAVLLAQGHNFVTTASGGIFKLADGNPAPPTLGGRSSMSLGQFSNSFYSLSPMAGHPAVSAGNLQDIVPAHLFNYFHQQSQLEEMMLNQTLQQQPGHQTNYHLQM